VLITRDTSDIVRPLAMQATMFNPRKHKWGVKNARVR